METDNTEKLLLERSQLMFANAIDGFKNALVFMASECDRCLWHMGRAKALNDAALEYRKRRVSYVQECNKKRRALPDPVANGGLEQSNGYYDLTRGCLVAQPVAVSQPISIPSPQPAESAEAIAAAALENFIDIHDAGPFDEIVNCPKTCRERHLRLAYQLEVKIPGMPETHAAIATHIVELMRRPKTLGLGRNASYTGEVLSAVVACFAYAKTHANNAENIVRIVNEDMGHTGKNTFQCSNLNDRIPILSGQTLKWIAIRTLAKQYPLNVIF